DLVNGFKSGSANTETNIFVRDLVMGTTTLVSINRSGTASGNADSYNAVISANGRYVIFVSDASDLVANDGNIYSDVFERDLVAQTTSLVSVNINGTSANFSSYSALVT